jgi:hypothetical protein
MGPIEGPTTPERDGSRPTVGAGDTFLVERCGWSLVWLAVLVGGLDLWDTWSAWSLGGVAAPLMVLAGIAGLAATWWVRSPRLLVFQLLGLVPVMVGILGQEGAYIHVRQFYSTDSAAFNQVAARLLAHGINPYASSLASADRLLQQPSAYWTYTVGGGHVTHVSYPAGSFLLDALLYALGLHHMTVDWLDLVAWLVTGALLFAFVPVALRWFSVLLFAVPIFGAVFGSGGTDAMFLPFLVLAVWRWDRFGVAKSAGMARWLGPLALGVACSIKQTPWFCVPFLVIGVFLEARATGRRPWRLASIYLAVVVGVFAVVNVPFIVWGPRAWIEGTLLPFTHPLVADGQGLVTLALHGVAHGVSLPLLTVAGALVLVALLAAMALWYPQMKRIWLMLLPLTFFVATRSLSSYLLDLAPAAIVAACSVASAPEPSRAAAHGGRAGNARMPAVLATAVPALAAVAVAVLAFLAPPLDLTLGSVNTSKTATVLNALTLTVHNTTDQTVTPHFMVTINSGHPNGFWHALRRRPLVLGPHASTTVTIVPDHFTWAPTHGTHWLVAAYTSSPEALSTTGQLFWTLGKPTAQSP